MSKNNSSKTPFDNLTKEEAASLLRQHPRGQVGVIPTEHFKRLVELGVEFTSSPGESLQDFFERTKQHAETMVNTLPPMPNWLEYQFRCPYYEARCCLLLGLAGASITQSAILLERVLKWTAFCIEIQSAEIDPKTRWLEIEDKMQFGDAIGFAKKMGLIDKQLTKKLNRFRSDIRNTQGHLKIYHATKAAKFNKTTSINLKTKEILHGQELSAIETPTTAALAKEKLDQLRAPSVFIFMHESIEQLFKKLDQQRTINKR